MGCGFFKTNLLHTKCFGQTGVFVLFDKER